MLTFDLQADLSQAFNWNVKQLFVFVVAEFATPTNVSAPDAHAKRASWARCSHAPGVVPVADTTEPLSAERPQPPFATLVTSQKLNQVVIWDHVVPDAESAVLKYADEPNKYPLVDQGTELRGVDVRLRLYWDSMPLSGSLLLDRSAPRAATMPSSYT